MNKWGVEFCNARTEKEFLSFPKDVQARFTRLLDMFIENGPDSLVMPLAKPLDSKLWELRTTGKDGAAQCLYVLDAGQTMVILRAFSKKTQKTPRKEIDIAWERWRNRQ